MVEINECGEACLQGQPCNSNMCSYASKQDRNCSTQPHIPDNHHFYLHNQLINDSEVWRIICSQISNIFQKEAKQFLQEHGMGTELSANKLTGIPHALPTPQLRRGVRAATHSTRAKNPASGEEEQRKGELGPSSGPEQPTAPQS